jgi:signal transduction histidine kinase
MIFVIVFFLYNVPLESVSYAMLLSTIGAIVYLGFDFVAFYKRHKELMKLMDSIPIHLESLPETNALIEKDYQNLLMGLYQDKIKHISQWSISMTDMMNYYTLWTHQIKTPIAAIKLLLQESDHVQNAEALQELFKIERYVELAIQYARLESISSDLMLETYSLNQIVKQAIKKYSIIFIHKKIKLEFEELNDTVLTDEKWLIFVIEQILSNALKYTATGTISIYMDPNTEKTLIIEDTGIGIQAEDLPRVFEKGFTGYNGRMDKKSTGIGLNLCKQILDKLSHKISITSQVEVGTQVRLDLSTAKTFIE